MRLLVGVFLLIVLLAAEAVNAQTATLTPTPVPTSTPSPQPTFTPYSFDDMVGTLGIPSAIPALSMTPKPWNTPTPPVKGEPFSAPTFEVGTPSTDEAAVHGFEAISQSNTLRLGAYIATIAVGFYQWANANFYDALRALRLMSIIVFLMGALFAIIRRFAPDLVSRANTWRNGKDSGKGSS